MNIEKKKELLKKIELLICDLYEVIFTGRMNVEETEDGYLLRLYLTEDPLNYIGILIQCNSEDEFLTSLREDLHRRRLNMTKYYVGQQIQLHDYNKTRVQGRHNPEI